MIESIEIKNFRCFKDTKIAKFGLVNIFGGLNNSGKTALLEAIYLAANPTLHSVMFLTNKVRNESSRFGQVKPKDKWNNFFYQQNKDNPIEIVIDSKGFGNRKVSLVCDDRVDDLIQISQENKNLHKEERDYVRFISDEQTFKSVLHINTFKNGNEDYSGNIIAEERGIFGNFSNNVENNLVNFILANQKLSNNEWLSQEYDKARFEGKKEIVLKTLQLIDSNIEDIDVFLIGEPVIYLTKKNENRMPLTLYGDAINTVTSFILHIINNKGSFVLIDEIENGIHYTKQTELWEMLFKLAIKFNVQIFSTSHSLEMINAFAKIADTPEFLEKAAYFELRRHEEGDIICDPIPIHVLNYDIENDSSFRGE